VEVEQRLRGRRPGRPVPAVNCFENGGCRLTHGVNRPAPAFLSHDKETYFTWTVISVAVVVALVKVTFPSAFRRRNPALPTGLATVRVRVFAS
jgi:hypothetical protein